jgi:hypothetical protein
MGILSERSRIWYKTKRAGATPKSQLGGPGADIPEMSLSKYPWPGLLVKGILIVIPIRRFEIGGCDFWPVYGRPSDEHGQLQLQRADPGGRLWLSIGLFGTK